MTVFAEIAECDADDMVIFMDMPERLTPIRRQPDRAHGLYVSDGPALPFHVVTGEGEDYTKFQGAQLPCRATSEMVTTKGNRLRRILVLEPQEESVWPNAYLQRVDAGKFMLKPF